MKKLIGIGALLLVAACQRKVTVGSPAPTAANTGPGGATVSGALSAFMAAAKAEDLQAVASVWGTPSGPARDQMSRSEFEMRAYYIVKCVRHDSYTMLSESNAANGQRIGQVQIKKGPVTKVANFTFVPGPNGRWFVYNVDLNALNDICMLATT